MLVNSSKAANELRPGDTIVIGMPERGGNTYYGFIARVDSVAPDNPGYLAVEYTIPSTNYRDTYGCKVYEVGQSVDIVMHASEEV